MKTVNQSNKRLHYVLSMLMVCGGLVIALASCVSCVVHGTRQMKRDVDSFAVNYFNWQFHKTIRYVAPESEKWIVYAASQVHQADIDLLKEKEHPATCEIKDVTIVDDDLTAVVHVTIHDFLYMDTIGKAASIIDAADFDIPLHYIQEEGVWKVNIQGALRPVKHGR